MFSPAILQTYAAAFQALQQFAEDMGLDVKDHAELIMSEAVWNAAQCMPKEKCISAIEGMWAARMKVIEEKRAAEEAAKLVQKSPTEQQN